MWTLRLRTFGAHKRWIQRGPFKSFHVLNFTQTLDLSRKVGFVNRIGYYTRCDRVLSHNLHLCYTTATKTECWDWKISRISLKINRHMYKPISIEPTGIKKRKNGRCGKAFSMLYDLGFLKRRANRVLKGRQWIGISSSIADVHWRLLPPPIK